jgi:uncharacterized membrane protein
MTPSDGPGTSPVSAAPEPLRPAADAPAHAAARTADSVVVSSRAWALGSLGALIVLGMAWELWLAPTGSGTLALKVLPLVFAVPGVLRHRMATHRWLSLLVWLYVLEGLVRATSEGGLSQGLAVLEVVFALALFAASSVHIRWRLRQARS